MAVLRNIHARRCYVDKSTTKTSLSRYCSRLFSSDDKRADCPKNGRGGRTGGLSVGGDDDGGGAKGFSSRRSLLVDRIRQAEFRRREHRNFLNNRKNEDKEVEGKFKSKYDHIPTPPANWRTVAFKIAFAGWIENDGGVGAVLSEASATASASSSSLAQALTQLQRALVRTRLVDDLSSTDFCYHDGFSSPLKATVASSSSSPLPSSPPPSSSSKPTRRNVIGEIGGVVTAEVRTNRSSGVGVRLDTAFVSQAAPKLSLTPHPPEIPYARVINAALPEGIRVVAWAPLPRCPSTTIESGNAATISLFVPKALADAQALKREACRIIKSTNAEKIEKFDNDDVEVIELTGPKDHDDDDDDEDQISRLECLDVIELRVTLRGRSGNFLSLAKKIVAAAALEKWAADMSDSHVITATPRTRFADSSSFLFIHAACFSRLQWRYDVDAAIDVSLHFQRLQTELAIKTAIVQQAVAKVEGLLSSLAERAVEKERLVTVDENEDGSGSTEKDTRDKRKYIEALPYRSPLDDIMTSLPFGYLTRNYDSYVDFVTRRRERLLKGSNAKNS